MSFNDAMIGKVLKSVHLDKANDTLVFECRDGSRFAFTSIGDCCSTSWIEAVEAPSDVDGATVRAFGESASVYADDPGHECLQVYTEQVITDRGEIVVEFRNSSNGYYGGWLQEVAQAEPQTGGPALNTGSLADMLRRTYTGDR